MLFDAIQAILGRPDPRMAVAQALGQAPGQPGGGPPVPGAPSPAPGGGGPPPSPGGPQAAAGPPQGQGAQPATMPNGQPAPTAFQSPSDLAQAYLKLASYNQNAEMFNRALGGIAGSFGPVATRPALTHAYDNAVQDPNSVFDAMMKLQGYGQRQAYIQDLDGMMAKYNLDPSLKPLLAANPDILSKIVETRAGVGGDSATQELRQARAEWHDQNPGKTDADMIAAKPELAGVIEFTGAKTEEAKTAAANAADLTADQHSFTSADADYRQTEQLLGWLKAHPEATAEAVRYGSLATGRMGQLGSAVGALSPDASTAAGYLGQLQGKLYSDSWKGRGGRLSQLEAGKISEGFSQLNNPNMPADQINQQVSDLYDKTRQAHANVYGYSGMPTPSEYYGLMDDNLKKGGKLFKGATELTSSGSGSAAAPPIGPGSRGSAQGGRAPTADELAEFKRRVDAGADPDKLRANARANGVNFP